MDISTHVRARRNLALIGAPRRAALTRESCVSRLTFHVSLSGGQLDDLGDFVACVPNAELGSPPSIRAPNIRSSLMDRCLPSMQTWRHEPPRCNDCALGGLCDPCRVTSGIPRIHTYCIRHARRRCASCRPQVAPESVVGSPKCSTHGRC